MHDKLIKGGGSSVESSGIRQLADRVRFLGPSQNFISNEVPDLMQPRIQMDML